MFLLLFLFFFFWFLSFSMYSVAFSISRRFSAVSRERGDNLVGRVEEGEKKVELVIMWDRICARV